MKIKYVFIITILFMINITAGCTYNNKLVFNDTMTMPQNSGAKYILAVVTNTDSGAVIAKPGFISLTVERDEALNELIKNKLSPYFNKVYFINDDNKANPYDYILSYKTNTVSMCSRSCYLNTNVSISVKKKITDKNLIIAQDFTDQYVYDTPGSVTAISIFSGLTLCAVCPITGPIMTNMCGDELSNDVSMSNDRIATRVVDIIKSSELIQ